MKGSIKSSHQKVHLNFAKHLGRQSLEDCFSGLLVLVGHFFEGSCRVVGRIPRRVLRRVLEESRRELLTHSKSLRVEQRSEEEVQVCKYQKITLAQKEFLSLLFLLFVCPRTTQQINPKNNKNPCFILLFALCPWQGFAQREANNPKQKSSRTASAFSSSDKLSSSSSSSSFTRRGLTHVDCLGTCTSFL